jgi:propionyl-CoA carboxylase alpha chain
VSLVVRPIRTLLIANRGEIACRITRTAHAMGIRTVAVYSDPDAGAAHVAACDLAVPLGGARSDESYLRADKLLAAAHRSGADAVHPGYGFLSEDPTFAEACVAEGLTWVGPPVAAMRAMAAKIGAKERAATLGVPLLPGATLDGDDPAGWHRAAHPVGWPLLLKASAGGGGKGMRVISSADGLEAAVDAGRREAAAAFGDATVFLERYLAAPRHVEVQVFADQHGAVVHLFERECSIQRRHQKVIEEATSAAVDDTLRDRITDAAIRLAAGIGYVGAGTVEFLVDGGEFFFLEMNTRLQVEHPVTEAILGRDLVRLQLSVAQGEHLGFGQFDVFPHGHAIEARLYAEDVPGGFLPAPGTLHRYERARLEGVRYDDGVESGSVISSYYDPMIAKVVAHAHTRTEASLRLAAALAQTRTFGLTTNRDLLVATLRHDAFLDGDTTTAFFDQHPEVLNAGPSGEARRASAIAVALVAQERDRPRTGALASVPSGWRDLPGDAQRRVLSPPRGCGDDVEVAYRFGRAGEITVAVDGEPAAVRIYQLDAAGIDIEIEGIRRRVVVDEAPDRSGRRLGSSGSDGDMEWIEAPRFRISDSRRSGTGPTAPLPGVVVQVAVDPGAEVAAGDVLMVIEAMKMEHTITAAVDAVIGSVLAAVGDSVEAGQILLTFAVPDGRPPGGRRAAATVLW